MSADLIQILIGGLAMGAIYALVALGYTLIWNAVSVVNFAQGDLVMLGAFVSVGWLVNGLNLPLWANIPLLLIITAGFGVIIAVGIYHPLRNAPQLSAIVATLGLSMLLQNLAVLVWGPEPLAYPGPFGNATINVFGANIYAQYGLILVILIVLMLGQSMLFRHTSIGRAMRATAQDPEAARLMGVRTSVTIALIFAYSAVLAGIAGWLVAPLFYTSSDMGVNVSLKAFAATILGGFGSMPGALIGGLLIGVINSAGAYYISSTYIDIITFGVLFAVLVLRPQGIFGEQMLERP